MIEFFRKQPVTVIKIGGSLFQFRDLKTQLLEFLHRHESEWENLVLLPGGGSLADQIRELDKLHRLGDVLSHRLGVQSLSVTAHFIAGLSRRFDYVSSTDELPRHWQANQFPVLDTSQLVQETTSLPASWDVTSDSIAAWLSSFHAESKLILLKSVHLPESISYSAAAEEGLVDLHFPTIAKSLNQIAWCNLRSAKMELHTWGI